MPRSRSFYIKTICFSFALFVESLVLASYLFNFAVSKDYFTLDMNLIFTVAGLLLLIAYTYSLTVGAWDVWLQYVVVPLPICAANALLVARINYLYAIIVFFASYIFLSYDVFFASQLKQQLIKFNPRFILRFSTKGLLFFFALMGGLFIMLVPISPEELNIVDSMTDIANSQVQFVVGSVTGQSSELEMLQNLGLVNLDFRDMLRTQIDDMVTPYKDYFVPIVALVTIASIQFLNSMVYLVFAASIGLFFKIAKRLGILRSEFEEVTKENLTY